VTYTEVFTGKEGEEYVMWCKFGSYWRHKIVRETMTRIFRPYVEKSQLFRCGGTKIWMDKILDKRFSCVDAEVGIRRISGCNNTEKEQRTGICK
jgi:hypothetical protein